MRPLHRHSFSTPTFDAIEGGDAFDRRSFVVGGARSRGLIDVETRGGSDVSFAKARVPRLPGRTVMRVQPLRRKTNIDE